MGVCLNHSIPGFLKWTLPCLNFDISTNAKKRFNTKIKYRIANSVDPDETARYEPSHLDLHCLHRHLFWSAGLKGLDNDKTLHFYFSCVKRQTKTDVLKYFESRVKSP